MQGLDVLTKNVKKDKLSSPFIADHKITFAQPLRAANFNTYAGTPSAANLPTVILSKDSGGGGARGTWTLKADQDDLVVTKDMFASFGLSNRNISWMSISNNPIVVRLFGRGDLTDGRDFGPGTYTISRYWKNEATFGDNVEKMIISWAKGYRVYPNVASF